MNYEHGTFIIPLAAVAILRELSQMLDRNETDNMFIIGLSLTGALPATHFISTGPVPTDFALTIRSAALLFSKSQAAFVKENKPFKLTNKQIVDLLAVCNISNGKKKVIKNKITAEIAETPFDVIDRLGLKLIKSTI